MADKQAPVYTRGMGGGDGQQGPIPRRDAPRGHINPLNHLHGQWVRENIEHVSERDDAAHANATDTERAGKPPLPVVEIECPRCHVPCNAALFSAHTHEWFRPMQRRSCDPYAKGCCNPNGTGGEVVACTLCDPQRTRLCPPCIAELRAGKQ